jgi:hypothetical protein
MPWFPDSESGAFADIIDEPLPTLLAAGSFPVPCTLEHAAVNLAVGPAIFGIVDEMIREEVVGSEHRIAAAVVISSFMLPMLAREDRIAAYLGLDRTKVRQMGWRLRCGGIWQGDRLAQDCCDDLFSDDPLRSDVTLMLFCAVAEGQFWAKREPDGLYYSLERLAPPLHVEGRPCPKCWGTLRYGSGGQCVACTRRYNKGYNKRREAG